METMPILTIQKDSSNVTKMVKQLLLNVEPGLSMIRTMESVTGHNDLQHNKHKQYIK